MSAAHTALYRIESLQTGHVIVTTEHDKPDQRVVLEPAAHPLHHTVVTITPSIDGPGPKFATVKGRSGLFIAVHKEETGEHLIWSKNEFRWEFATNGPTGTHSVFPPGKDLFWYDKGAQRHIVLEPGHNAKQNEIFYKLIRIDRLEE